MKQHIACPREDCDSSDAYTLYDDGHGWCFSCGKGTFPNKIVPGDFERKFVDGVRGIPKKVCEKLGIYTYVDDAGNPVFREYAYPEGSKFRRIHDKSFWVEGTMPPLGGMELWNAGSSHYITVVEGEEDGAAAYHMLNHGKQNPEPVVWLTSAVVPNKYRDSIYKYLSQFQTVKLAIEDDAAGKKVKELLCQMLPNKIREVSLTKYKDANDYLINGATKEFKQAHANAQIYTPDNIFHTEDDVLDILSNPDAGKYFPTPFADLNEKIRGLSLNHVTLITGMEGLGKTEIIRAFEVEALRQGVKIGVLHLEETKDTLYKGLACYPLEKNTRDPDNPVNLNEIMKGLGVLTNNYKNLFVFEFKKDPSVEDVLEQINYLVHVCGCELIFFDPINQFDPVDERTTKVQFLDSLSKKVEKYVVNHPCGVVWTAHINDEGGTRDSRMIGKACSVRIMIERDLMAEGDTERNTTKLYVSKNRPFTKTGPAGALFFDEDTFTISSSHLSEEELTGLEPIPF